MNNCSVGLRCCCAANEGLHREPGDSRVIHLLTTLVREALQWEQAKNCPSVCLILDCTGGEALRCCLPMRLFLPTGPMESVAPGAEAQVRLQAQGVGAQP